MVLDLDAGRSSQCRWYLYAEIVQQTADVTGPAHRNGRGGKAVFEDQQQPHRPGDEFAHRRVGIGIGRARYRDRRSKLGISQSHKRAERAGDDEGNHDRRAGEIRRRPPRQNENPGADDAADAKKNEIERPERFLELALFMLDMHLLDGLAEKQACKTGRTRRRAAHRGVSHYFSYRQAALQAAYVNGRLASVARSGKRKAA